MEKSGLSTRDLFKNKKIPIAVSEHPLFKEGSIVASHQETDKKITKYEKIFPSIGLPNFSQETDIPRVVGDLRKETSYVYKVLKEIHQELTRARDIATMSSEAVQFLAPLEERLAKKAKNEALLELTNTITSVAGFCDPSAAPTWHPTQGTVITANTKVELKLPREILNTQGKSIYRKGYGIFKLYSRLRELCMEHGVKPEDIKELEAMASYKTFSAESIPNKTYNVIFSSTGHDGAWDILTMSVRGTKSCLRWGGEHEKCLIGSLISKFVGIIYLTSGAEADPYADWGVLGTKMMRRCIVRYAYDRELKTPCLIVDKMYLSEDPETLKVFMKVISDRAAFFDKKEGKKKSIPVYYGPSLGVKTKHIYFFNDQKLDYISHRERSYQDTVLRSKMELDIHLLMNNQIDESKYRIRIQNNFMFFLASRLEEIGATKKLPKYIHPDFAKFIAEQRLLHSNMYIGETLANCIYDVMVIPPAKIGHTSQSFYRAFLKSIFKNRKQIVVESKNNFLNFIDNYDPNRYCSADLLASQMKIFIMEFVKKEYLTRF